MAAADPEGLERLGDTLQPASTMDLANAADGDDLEAIVARGVAHLSGYQNAAWARRFETRIRALQKRESALGGDASLPFTRNAARSLLKLMSYKDEYEVARLYTDGSFQRSLMEQFEGEKIKLEFHMAPPFLAPPKNGQAPRKIRFGAWMLPAMRVLARGKALRHTPFDPFGRTQERRLERELIAHFEARLDELAQDMAAADQKLLADIAALPMTIRGYGHVKIGNLALARAREAELLHRLRPQRYPAPASTKAAGQIKGIAIVAAH